MCEEFSAMKVTKNANECQRKTPVFSGLSANKKSFLNSI